MLFEVVNSNCWYDLCRMITWMFSATPPSLERPSWMIWSRESVLGSLARPWLNWGNLRIQSCWRSSRNVLEHLIGTSWTELSRFWRLWRSTNNSRNTRKKTKRIFENPSTESPSKNCNRSCWMPSNSLSDWARKWGNNDRRQPLSPFLTKQLLHFLFGMISADYSLVVNFTFILNLFN